MFVPLNRFLARALSVQVLGGLPQERDDVLLGAKVALANVLKVFARNPAVQSLLQIQRELCKILLMNTDQETVDVLLRNNTLVSYGLEHLLHVENMPVEILEFITTVVTQEDIQKKILAFLCILSKAMVDCKSNVYLDHLFELDHALSKILAEKEEDNKLDSLCGLCFRLTEFMVTDYPDENTEWIVQLNLLASWTMVEKFEDPKHLFRANNILSQAMRKLADKPFFGELIELNCILSTVFLVDDETDTKYNLMIGWKLILTLVMQDVLADASVKNFKKSARETEKEEVELDRLNTQLALVTQERDEIREKAQDMRKEIEELVKERAQFKKEIYELVKDNSTLNVANKAMKKEQQQDETAEEMENPDLRKSEETEILHEPEEKPEETEILHGPEEKPEETEIRHAPEEKSEKTEILRGPEEKSKEEPVGQLLNEEMKNEGGKVSEVKTEKATESSAAGVSVGMKTVAEEVAGPSKGSQKNSKNKSKLSGKNTGVKKDDVKNAGSGVSKKKRSKKK